MRFLLDVNALLAWGYEEHVHHQRVRQWLTQQSMISGSSPGLATCAITDLGFIRIATGSGQFADSIETAVRQLCKLKARADLGFLADDVGGEVLPDWVQKSSQTTDGHLVMLAAKHGIQLATLDESIPGAELIRDLPTPWMIREPAARYGTAA